jgi:hypothetical protein
MQGGRSPLAASGDLRFNPRSSAQSVIQIFLFCATQTEASRWFSPVTLPSPAKFFGDDGV